MPSCVAYGCVNRTSKNVQGLTFHRFPVDETVKKRWIQAVRRKDWEPTSASRLCSVHFEPHVIDRSMKQVRLKENAVPTIFPAFPEHLKPMIEGGVPRPRGRLLHFSDGTLEDHSSDEEHSTDEERPNEVPVDPKTLTWRPWMWYYVSTAGCKTLQVCDYLGESLAHFFGITSPKYQYEIEEYYRAKAEEEEYKKKQDLEMRGWLEKPTGVKVEEPLRY